jgi:hypothetical protein
MMFGMQPHFVPIRRNMKKEKTGLFDPENKLISLT